MKESVGFRLRKLREQYGYSQEKLAEDSGLSLRSVQRIESGNVKPRGHSLRALANALSVSVSELSASTKGAGESITRLSLMNLSVFTCIVLPYANLILPFILWYRSKNLPIVNQYGRKILNFQITWTLLASLLLAVAPFVQLIFVSSDSATTIRPVLLTYIPLLIYNLVMTYKIGRKIKREQFEMIYRNAPQFL